MPRPKTPKLTPEQRARYSSKWATLQISTRLKTRELLTEIADILGPDYTGNSQPLFAIVHQALLDYRDKAIAARAIADAQSPVPAGIASPGASCAATGAEKGSGL